ncbi:MAG: response regulator [Ignavibacteriales bacterium]|nr:response regulator [Ignavibacteriales bacterium]
MAVAGRWNTEKAAGRKVLVVDDEVVAANSVRRTLNRRGFRVDEAFSGREALNRILNEMYDLVLLDMKMPDTNGLELLPTIKKHRPKLPVVMVTGTRRSTRPSRPSSEARPTTSPSPSRRKSSSARPARRFGGRWFRIVCPWADSKRGPGSAWWRGPWPSPWPAPSDTPTTSPKPTGCSTTASASSSADWPAACSRSRRAPALSPRPSARWRSSAPRSSRRSSCCSSGRRPAWSPRMPTPPSSSPRQPCSPPRRSS